MINRFLRVLFTETCPVCKKPSTDHRTAPICTDCWQSISPYNGAICQKCGRPLSSDVSITCGFCIEDVPAFKCARSYGLYEGTLKEAINLIKYYGIKRLSKPLSEMTFTMLDNKHTDAIIPVPLYKKRLRQRGFNQSALFAKHLADHTGIPLFLDYLIKTRDTVPQVGLSAKERRKNMKNAFAVINEKLIQGKDVLLVDDVFTTGATVRECSKVLKKSGAKDVYVITLTHSGGD